MLLQIGLLFCVSTTPTFAVGTAKSEVNFEIYNKDANEIKVTVNVSPGQISPNLADTKVSSSSTLQATISGSDNKAGLEITIQTNGKPYYFTVFPGSNTAFMSFDSQRPIKLYPETGPKIKLWRQTQSGLSLKNNLTQAQISETTKVVEKKAKDALDALEPKVKNVALALKAIDSPNAAGLYAAVLKDEHFRDAIMGATIPPDSDQLVSKLIELRTLQQVKERYGPTFAGKWQEKLVEGKLSIAAWNEPTANQLDLFASVYASDLKNKYVSSSLVLKYLPKDFEALDKVDKYTKKPDEMKGIDPALFQSFLAKVPVDKKLEVELDKVKELVEFGSKLIQKSGYSNELVGGTMATFVVKHGLAKSVSKGMVFGWNPSTEFETEIPSLVFADFVGEAGALDFGQTQLLVHNFFKNIKYPVSAGDLSYAKEIGKFFKEKVSQGFAFSNVNAAIVKNLKFDPKSSAKEAATLGAALSAISLQKPVIDGDVIFKQIREHPLTAVGIVLQRFVADLLPEKEQKKAVAISKSFKELDQFATGIKAVSKMRSILDTNRVVIVNLLPTALHDTDKAAQNLILAALSTIHAKIENKPASVEISQLSDLVTWIMKQAQLLRGANPEESILSDMILTESDQSAIRFGLKSIKIAGILDSLVGRKIIERILMGSEEFKAQMNPEVIKKMTPLIASIASVGAGAIPSLVQKFSVTKYLDFLRKVADYKDQKIQEIELKTEVWKILEVLVVDISKLSGALPHAFDAVREFGMEQTTTP